MNKYYLSGTLNNKALYKENKHKWVHFNITAKVPPTIDGSYNFLIWDIIRKRSHSDLLISKFYPDSFAKAKYSDCKVIQVEKESKNPFVKYYDWMSEVLNYFGFNVPSSFIRTIVSLIKRSGCRNILVWGDIALLPILRKLLPDYTIAYAQRHYDYPVEKSFYNYCDFLITQTRGQTKHAFDRMVRLTPFVVTIPNGVELDTFRPIKTNKERNDIRDKLSLSRNSFIIIFPSKLELHKGVRYLHRIIKITGKCEPRIQFLIIGKISKIPENYKYELDHFLCDHPNVAWVNGVSRMQMPDYYRAANVCLMPCLWREGFSMAAIEALSSGLPLIASAAGCYLEIIKNGYNGYICRQEYLMEDSLKSIKQLYNDRMLLEKLSKNARKYAELRLSRKKVINNFNLFLDGKFEQIDSNINFND